MPNETVMNTGYGFSASPGQHVNVMLKSTTVTRLGSPQGSCTNTTSLYETQTNYKTEKECKLTNLIWYFLKNSACRCWPWFVQDRFMKEKVCTLTVQRLGVIRYDNGQGYCPGQGEATLYSECQTHRLRSARS